MLLIGGVVADGGAIIIVFAYPGRVVRFQGFIYECI